MKKLDFKRISLLLIGIVFLIACDNIFVPDPIDPRLPKYTEEGYETGGAFINDSLWKSVNDSRHITIWKKQDSIVIMLEGRFKSKSTAIEFHLTGLNISNFADLESLQGKKIPLDGVKNTGYYCVGYNDINYENKGIGQLYIRKVKIEGRNSPTTTLSGTFGFTVTDDDGKKTKVSYGRFDYTFNDSDIITRDE